MGLIHRRLYKPERKPARTKGVLSNQAPIMLPDAQRGELATALFALGLEAGVIVGRGAEYDALRDEYVVLGKSRSTGKAQDFKIQGAEVAQAIMLCRMLYGGKMHRRAG